MRASAAAAILAWGVLSAAGPGPARAQAPAGQAVAPVQVLGIDAFVYDNQGRPVPGLAPSDFTVTVDGTPRRVVAARYVYRGPGAEVAAARAAGTNDAALAALRQALGTPDPARATRPLAEPSRSILLVLDELGIPRGSEKPFATATDRLLDRFGPADHVALLPVPMQASQLAVLFTDDRASVRETLAKVVGRALPADALARAGDLRADPLADVTAGAAAAAGVATGVEDPATARPPTEERKDAAADVPRDPNAATERAESVLEALTRLLADLRVAPGLKTVVVTTGGIPEPDRDRGRAGVAPDAARNQAAATEAAAVAARAVVYVLAVSPPGGGTSWSELEQVARNTGGELVRVGRNVDQALDRVGLGVSGSYALEVEAAPGDRDGRSHALRVAIARPGATVRSARRLVARTDPGFVEVGRAAGPLTGVSDLPENVEALAAAPEKRRRGEPAPDPELDTVVARAMEYLSGYFREFRNVVAEEDYRQTNRTVNPPDVRRLKSDFLLVTTADGKTWVPFRDVFEVDGTPIRDREDRLRKLFLEAPPAGALDAAAKVQAEGARYNLVSPRTTVNVPTFALAFLLEPNVRTFRFRRGREETVEGLRVLRVDYDEPGRPTAISSPSGVAAPSSGSFWIEPLTGRIVKSFLRAAREAADDGQTGALMEMTVVFRRSDRLGLWVPAEMRESYRLRGQVIEGQATYANFRSFQVRTEQEIKVK